MGAILPIVQLPPELNMTMLTISDSPVSDGTSFLRGSSILTITACNSVMIVDNRFHIGGRFDCFWNLGQTSGLRNLAGSQEMNTRRQSKTRC